MVTVQYAKAYPRMRINAVEPGFTATDLNANTGHQTVEEGAEIIVRIHDKEGRAVWTIPPSIRERGRTASPR